MLGVHSPCSVVRTGMNIVSATAPFAFAPALRFIKLNPGASGSALVKPGATLLHAARIGEAAVALEVSYAKSCDGDASASESVCYELLPSAGETLPGKPLSDEAVCAYLDNYLSLSVDLSGFYVLADRDKRFAAEVLSKLRGYHPVKFPTPLESAVWAVLSQATPQTIARKLMGAVAAAYGDPVPFGETLLTSFPAAQTLIDTPKGALRDLIANERKAKPSRPSRRRSKQPTLIGCETRPRSTWNHGCARFPASARGRRR